MTLDSNRIFLNPPKPTKHSQFYRDALPFSQTFIKVVRGSVVIDRSSNQISCEVNMSKQNSPTYKQNDSRQYFFPNGIHLSIKVIMLSLLLILL
jgi:hypothetical protein